MAFRVTVACVLVVLLLGGALLWLGGGTSGPGGADRGLPPGFDVPDAAAGRYRPAAAVPGALSGSALAGAAAAADLRAGPAVSVRVLDPDGRPIAGAVVDVLTANRPALIADPGPPGSPAAPSPAPRIAASAETDAAGICRLPAAAPDAMVIRARAGRYAAYFIPGYHGRPDASGAYVVTVELVQHVEVAVTNAAGRPLPHLPVSLGSFGCCREVAWTADDGIARLERLCGLADRYEGYEDYEDVPLVWIDDLGIPADPVSGSGRPPARFTVRVPGATVAVHARIAGPPRSGRILAWRSLGTRSSVGLEVGSIAGSLGNRPFDGGEVHVGRFRPGTRLALALFEEGRCRVDRVLDVPSDRDVVAVDLASGGAAPTVSARFVRPDGRPWSHVRLIAVPAREGDSRPATPAEEPPVEWTEITLDAGGVAKIVVPPGREGRISFRPHSRNIVPSLAPDHGPVAGLLRWATLEHPALASGSHHDVGEVVLEPIPLLAAGVVIDEKGTPITGANVMVDVDASAGPDFPLASDWVNGSWDTASGTSGEGGAFEIEGVIARESLLATASSGAAHRSAPVPFARGARNLEIRLRALATLVGRVTTSDPALQCLVTIDVTPVSDPDAPASSRDGAWARRPIGTAPDGRFRVGGLDRGTYRVRVDLAGIEALAISDLLIEEGGEVRDPRLDGAEVGRDFEMAEVRVRDEGGAPVPGASVSLMGNATSPAPRPATTFGSTSVFTDAAGLARCPMVRGQETQVVVNAEGFLRKIVRGPRFPLEVTLDPGCEVVVAIGGARAIFDASPPRGLSAHLDAEPRRGPSETRGGLDAAGLFDAVTSAVSLAAEVGLSTGEVRFRAVPSGCYRIVLRPRPLPGPGMDARNRGPSPAVEAVLGPIDVPAGRREAALRIDLTPEQVAALLGR